MDDQQSALLDEDELESPLNGSINQPQDEGKTKEAYIKKPNRQIIVEPLLVMLSLVSFPVQLTVSLFTYNKFEKDAAAKLGFNLSDLTFNSTCNTNTSSPAYEITQDAQFHNSMFNIATGVASTIPCLFTTVLLGPYSDKAGRKCAIMAPLIGGTLNMVVTLIVATCNFPVWYLLIGSFLDGLGGKYTMMLLGCFAYIADICEPKNRQFRITAVECIFFMSAMLGPIGIGYWIEKHGYVLPIAIGTGVYIVNIFYLVLFVPETVIKDPDVKFLTIEHTKKIVRLFTRDDGTKRRTKLRWLYLAFLPVIMVALGDQISTLFLQNLPFCWNSVKIGNYMAIYIAVFTIGGMISAKLWKMCLPDYYIALLSAASSVLRNTYHAFVKTDLMVYFVPVVSIFAVLFIPTLRAMMSNLVGPHEQGAVFGAIAISEVVFSFAGSFIFTAVYASTLSFMSGFTYLVMAGFYFMGFLILLSYIIWLLKYEKRNQETKEENEATE